MYKKRLLALIMAVVLIIAYIPCNKNAMAADTTSDVNFTVDSQTATPGSSVTVNVTMDKNPGVMGAVLKLDYSTGLQLTSAENGVAFGNLTYTEPGKLVSGCKFVWDAQKIDTTKSVAGKVLTLTFKVADDATSSDDLSVNVTCEDLTDSNLSSLTSSVTNGKITVNDLTMADVNSDSKINTTDVILMRRYIAGGYDVNIKTAAADVNGDSKVNTTDVILVRRYIAGGYDVVFKNADGTVASSDANHTHSLVHVDAVAATCSKAGNIEYWKCSSCGEYYTDANGINKVLAADTVVAALDHTPVVDEAVAPTIDSTGLTEGSHCSVCGATIVAQQTIAKLSSEDYYSITYNIYQDDTYLKSLTIENPNEAYYNTNTGLVLNEPEVPGYTFEGWYDGQGSSASRVKKIDAGTTGNIKLYAHWTVNTYTVTFDSPISPMDSITYTTNKGATLTNPSWFGYNFMGWTDADGNDVTKIEKGTTGEITLTANWCSKRNQTRLATNNDDPIIYEDEDNGKYYFVYEVGQIENVPLYTMKNFGNSSGITISETVTTSSKVSEETANTVANTVATATTKSQTWTLSQDWNDSLTQTASHTDESGQEIVDATSTVDSTSHAVASNASVTASNSASYTNKTTDVSSWKVGGEESYESTINAEINAKIGAGGAEVGSKIGASEKYALKVSSERSGSSTNENQSTKSASKTWNNSTSVNDAVSSSTSSSLSQAISSKVSDTYGYNKTHSEGGSESTANSNSTTSSESTQYAASVAYNNEETVTTSKTYSNANAPEGYYRLVCAGTIHMFAVVGYDVATSTYFTYSYGVQDDNTYDYIDYSKNSPNYNDYEYGVLPFEIPYYVNQYIDEQIAVTDGMVVDKSTGTITGYTGTATDVVIPDYITLDSVNGDPECVKITGIASDAFKGNTSITSIKIGKYVTEIPDSAFEGCTSLKTVEFPSVTKIGSKAFYGCSSMINYTISNKITSIGTNAFKDVLKVDATPATADIAQVICNSGAKQIILNVTDIASGLTGMTLSVPSSTEYVEFNGGKATYSNLQIASSAETTVINKMNIVNDGQAPLNSSSKEVKICSSTLSASGFAIILSADTVSMIIDGTDTITTSGSNAILTKDITLSQLLANSAAKLVVSGNIYVCDEMTDNGLLSISNGEVISINEDSYDSMKSGTIKWVLASSVPTGAKILDQKWTYDETTTTTSSSSTLAGYTLYNTTSAWGSYGSWSGWSTNAVSASDSRQIETQNVAATYKTQYRYSRYGSKSNGTGTIGPCKGTWSGVYCQYLVYTDWLDSAKSVSSTQYSSQVGGYFNLYDNNQWFNQETRSVVVSNAYTLYRYRDRSLVYTYYFKKVENKESTSEVTASGSISNVQKWVKYVVQ